MKKYVLLLLSTLLIIINGCEEDIPLPVASFTIKKGNSRIGTLITFTNSSENAAAYNWDFGDGTTSDEINPSHSYSSSGNYTIKLEAKGTGGTDLISESITILPALNSVAGNWEIIFTVDYNEYHGNLVLSQRQDSTLNGTFSFDEISQPSALLATSRFFTGNYIGMEWMLDKYRLTFLGTVNSFFDSMNGVYYVNYDSEFDSPAGTWKATRAAN